MSNYFPTILEWHVPEDLLRVAVEEMRLDGVDGCEGTCLWLGTRVDNRADIHSTVRLRGAGIRKGPTQIIIEPWLLHEVHLAARARELILVGQIHSHGTAYGVDLSPTDHTYGFRVPSFLSIVAPDYGMRWPIQWSDCGVHVFRDRQGFVRLLTRDVSRKIVTEAAATEVITIGDD